MPLCHLCSGLSFENLYPPNFYCHATDLASLEASASDCRLCRMLHGCINEPKEHSKQPELRFEGATDVCITSRKDREGSSIKLQIVPGDLYPWQPEREGASHVGIWMKSKWMVASLILSVEEGNKVCRCILHYLIIFPR